ncbi:DUF3667 domain-containing protein [Mongoliitalea daihaiensis]|uniref:DUF3667 domain-containing protein n=1 Tax=Mongoliitalea daihaiensis TaxID=2782006 RepID=UPI001F3F3433|nr:DUF3667 domain-containing protein [Mongoliitalea daihaiensis]UJP64705.1 DUF3667 domain-containing protein [Mongoliitalea daihaiensis]
MPADDRKLPYCLNCGEEFHQDENFCPACGQENKDSRMPIFVFLEDFFSTFLNFDTIFIRTVPAFITKPGALTLAFNEGRRRHFIQPIKLYLLMSLFYFFVFGLLIPKDVLDQAMMGSREGSPISMNGQFAEIRENLSEAERVEFDSLINKGALESVQTIWPQLAESINEQRVDWKELKFLAIDPLVSDEEFEEVFINSRFHLQHNLSISKIRAFIANSSFFINGVARNLPVMMFFILPFFALILQLLYVRGGFYFVEHLIHGLHLHAFAYFLYGLAISWGFVVDQYSEQVLGWSFILVSIYAYFSMKKVYGQGWFKTLVKFLFLGLFYLLFLLLGLILEVYITLLLL